MSPIKAFPDFLSGTLQSTVIILQMPNFLAAAQES
jgi:hypothetical protein